MLRLVARTAARQRHSLPSTLARTASGIADSVPPPTGETPDPNSSHPTEATPSSPDPPEAGSSSSTSSSPLETLSIPVPISGVPAQSNGKRSNGDDSDPHVIIPFDTHEFYKALEASFEPPVARTLMKATRGMLVDRIRKTTKGTLHQKDFENGAYLFRAALSEMRTELTMRTRKETATLRTTLTALRKEVDLLDSKMKEDIGSLKHEIQMDINNRKAESKAETKLADLAIEDFNHRTIVRIGDLRTEIEQAKWDNTRRGVFIIGALVLTVIFAMEVAPKRPPPPPPPAPPAPAPPAPILIERPLPSVRELEGGEAVEPEFVSSSTSDTIAK